MHSILSESFPISVATTFCDYFVFFFFFLLFFFLPFSLFFFWARFVFMSPLNFSLEIVLPKIRMLDSVTCTKPVKNQILWKFPMKNITRGQPPVFRVLTQMDAPFESSCGRPSGQHMHAEYHPKSSSNLYAGFISSFVLVWLTSHSGFSIFAHSALNGAIFHHSLVRFDVRGVRRLFVILVSFRLVLIHNIKYIIWLAVWLVCSLAQSY